MHNVHEMGIRITIHATINEIDDTFEIMLHVRDAKRKLQKRKINTLVENVNGHPIIS